MIPFYKEPDFYFVIAGLTYVIGVPVSYGYMVGAGVDVGAAIYGALIWPLILLGRIGYVLAT